MEGLKLPNIIFPKLYRKCSGKEQKPENTIHPGTV
jgi:hypothetical protein